MKDVFGMPQDFANLAETSVAAKGRVYMVDRLRPEGPFLQTLRRRLQVDRSHTPYPDREVAYDGWFKQAQVELIHRAVDALKVANLHPARVFRELRDSRTRGTIQERGNKAKAAIQGELRRRWQAHRTPTRLSRVIDKLERWQLPGRPP